MGKELKHLNRRELMDIIYQLKKSEQALQVENDQLREQLEVRRITLSKAGSVAEAALALGDVFTAAQKAADIYLAELEQRCHDIDQDYNQLIGNAKKKADDIIREAAEQRDAVIRDADKARILLKKYEAAIEKKKAELAAYDNRE